MLQFNLQVKAKTTRKITNEDFNDSLNKINDIFY